MFRPNKSIEGWRIRNNKELHKLIKRENIVKYKEAQRIKRWGHLNKWKIKTS